MASVMAIMSEVCGGGSEGIKVSVKSKSGVSLICCL